MRELRKEKDQSKSRGWKFPGVNKETGKLFIVFECIKRKFTLPAKKNWNTQKKTFFKVNNQLFEK